MPESYQKLNDEILQKNFLTEFRTGYIKIKNCVLPEYYLSLAKEVENFKVNNSDTWVCSFPKTGTTWTQEMVWMIANNMDFNGAQEILASRFPFLEVTSLFNFNSLMENNPNFRPPETLMNSVNFVKGLREPRFIKTHLPWNLLPNEIQSNNSKPKIIYVARNPKDTCVSYYYHCCLIEGYKGDFEKFAELFLTDRVCFGPFWKHVLGYWSRRNHSNILFLTYEEMKQDLPAVIIRVADFLGKKLSIDQINALTAHLSFDSMKRNPSVNYESIVELNRSFNLTDGNGSFMRSGKVGTYKADMSPEIVQCFDEWTRKHLEGVDFHFPELRI